MPTILGCWLALHAYAEPIWHCSRSPNTPVPAAKDNYLNKPNEQGNEVIRLTIRDLYEAYQDVPVYLGKSVLSACFMASNDENTQSALQAIGTDQKEVQDLAAQSHSKHLIMVKDELEMLRCIAENHPAIGYVSGPVNTSTIGPCFLRLS